MTQLASPWLTQRQLADHLKISERTLHRWRSTGLLQAGEHYRRKFPASNSPLLYQLERCEQLMSGLFQDERKATLKHQALVDLTAAYNNDKIDDTTYENIRRALEALPDD